ncbi:TfoX/Sxy family protein [Hylemonella gracilis]|uniref:TfoX domain-containing protein n=1 Tax=Hylemonella gracilis ATCC 19624 TaxID=887062 RepID=F3KU66_9BURK|nr:TfoX/Sxy family protein [Hylemonella gracilis]EGI76616.1 TfoX domain-containing protein [Hylemonella gracilis ATCC 19624]
MAHEALAEHCIELFSPLGRARARRMFGGQGLYVDDLFIALIVDGRLYLKTNDATQQHFADAGGQPFVYAGSERKPIVVMSYWTPPAEALESPALMTPWARLALEAALSARKAAPSRSSSRVSAKKVSPSRKTATPAAPKTAASRSRKS